MKRRSKVLACFVLSSVAVMTPGLTQEAATAGGDVTADEATPLPPIVVESPAESRKPKKVAKVKASTPSSPADPGGASSSSQGGQIGGGAADPAAGETGDGSAEQIFGTPGVFTLGQLDLIGGSTITNEAMYTFNKNSLDKALVPQDTATLAASPSGAPKNAPATPHAGVLKIASVAKAGKYQVTLSGPGWIDVIQGGAALPDVEHTGIADCPHARKSVRFEVKEGPAVIQVSGAAAAEMVVTIRLAE